jgi:hypothetical protein
MIRLGKAQVCKGPTSKTRRRMRAGVKNMALTPLSSKLRFQLMVDTFTFTIPMIILNLDKPELNIDPPKAERFVVSPSHRGVGFMPYGPEAEA